MNIDIMHVCVYKTDLKTTLVHKVQDTRQVYTVCNQLKKTQSQDLHVCGQFTCHEQRG